MTLEQAASEQPRGPMFTIITKALSGQPDAESGRRRFRATASSTIVDQKGDEIQLRALEQMAEQFRRGVGVFMDHDRSTGSAFGVTDGAEIIQRGMDERTGTPIWDLDIMGIVNTPNPRAAQLADSIDGGYVKLGASVTAWVRKHMRHPNGKGGMLISDLDAIEVSIVGVPENQRSWAQKAALAVKGFYSNAEEDPLVSDEDTNKVAAGAEVPDDAGAEPGTPDPATPATTTGDEPVSTGTEAAPAAEGNSDQESAEASAATAETPAGETPETATADETADPPVVEKAFDPGEVRELIGHVTALVTALNARDARIEVLEKQLKVYEGEASDITKEVDTAVKVIEKVLTQPLRPQTAGYVDALIEKSSLWSEVSPTIADYLSKRKHLTS